VSATPQRIVVVGSLNIDHTLRVARFPRAGETLTANSALTCYGGKGANQAIAAARAGGSVALIGCVGEDSGGEAYRRYLESEGIDIRGIATTATPTGSAFITLDENGENCILVHPGANHDLTPGRVDDLSKLITGASILLVQLECPFPAVSRAIKIASDAGVRVILNPSPWNERYLQADWAVDILIVNEHEATFITGGSLDVAQSDAASACAAARCPTLIITRGASPTLALTREGKVVEVAPPEVRPIDTVGAGDAFAGAFAVALAEKRSLPDALAFANAAGALATLAEGAQTALPRRAAILESAES